MDNITTIIANLGFPIACAIALALYVKYLTDKHDREIKELTQSHEKQMHELKESFDRNTTVLTDLVIYLKGVIKHE